MDVERPLDGGQLPDVAMRPLTRVKRARAALERAERETTEARLTLVSEIEAAREAGHSLGEIGIALGISHQRVHQLLKWGESTRKEPTRGKRSGKT